MEETILDKEKLKRARTVADGAAGALETEAKSAGRFGTTSRASSPVRAATV